MTDIHTELYLGVTSVRNYSQLLPKYNLRGDTFIQMSFLFKYYNIT